MLTDSRDQLMRAEASESRVMKLGATAKLFVIVIKKKKKRKLLQETLVINPDIYSIKITPCLQDFL